MNSLPQYHSKNNSSIGNQLWSFHHRADKGCTSTWARHLTSWRPGDLSALASHVLCRRDHLNPDFPIGSQTQLVLDFILGHTYSSSQRGSSMQCQHALKQSTLPSMETEKCATYKSDYHTQGHAFAPLVSNSYGQLGTCSWVLEVPVGIGRLCCTKSSSSPHTYLANSWPPSCRLWRW